MEDYRGITDQSSATRQRYDLVAEHQVRAYSSAMRKQINQENGADFLLTILGKGVWFLLVQPMFFILKLVIIWLIAFIQKQLKRVKKDHFKAETD